MSVQLWDDELEAMRSQLAEEAKTFIESFVSEVARDPELPAAERLAAFREDRFDSALHSEHGVDRTIDGPGGAIRLRTFVPEGDATGVYLHIHGGGMISGTPELTDLLNEIIMQEIGVAVVSVDYRLAPEHPYPAGSDDCEAAAAWVAEHAAAEYGSDKLLIGGESAGAYYSAVTLLRMRDRHDAADRFRGANLIFGLYDLSCTPSKRGIGMDESRDVLTVEMCDLFDRFFLGDRSLEERRDPDISPLHADLRDMPPALFSVGERDLLVDDTLFMAQRWARAGNRAELLVYPEGPHACIAMPSIGAHFFPRMFDFFRECLAD
jgi:acetyl esterase/lipase